MPQFCQQNSVFRFLTVSDNISCYKIPEFYEEKLGTKANRIM